MTFEVEARMAIHLSLINNNHYLGWNIEYEIINVMVTKMREEMSSKIKTNIYSINFIQSHIEKLYTNTDTNLNYQKKTKWKIK